MLQPLQEDVDTVVSFIIARVEEDERLALSARSGEWWAATEPGKIPIVAADDGYAVAVCGQPDVAPVHANARHIAQHSGNQVLRQATAIRAVLAGVAKYLDPHPGQACTNVGQRGPCRLHFMATGRVSVEVLPIIASMWSNHPDYDPAWVSRFHLC